MKKLAMKGAKQIVWRYDGEASSEETEFDPAGLKQIPLRGTKIVRKGKTWEVVHILTEEHLGMPKVVPVYRMFLKSTS